MQDFDKLWNYNDPTDTEVKFREVLKTSPAEKDLSYHLQLLTQIARTYGLRDMFNEAHSTLDEVKAALPGEPGVEHIRYHLERGRTFNSNGKKDEAREHFKEAESIAQNLKEEGYRMDAIHMLALAAPAGEACRINEEAVIIAESSDDERAKNWLGPLYNNLGWDYFERSEYEKALSVFLRALKWQQDRNRTGGIFIVKWCIARVLRALNRNDEAMKVQLALFEESAATGRPDGYVHEELGELFLLKDDQLKCSFHFQKAYEQLSQDLYLPPDVKGRLERMKKLSGRPL